MNIKKHLYKIKIIFKDLLYSITGLSIYKKLPLGINPFIDIQFKFKDYSFTLFFDIGANTGQTVKDIRKVFPKTAIWSFEPVEKTFKILQVNTVNQKVNCFQIGFGSQDMETEILISNDNSVSEMNSIFNVGIKNINSLEKEIIQIKKLDTFCINHSINKIDYVKIDTEGYDLEVLKGSYELLKNQSISFVEVEVSMNPENTYHVKFEKIKEYMESFDYRVFGIYDQTQEWPTKTPILRRVNALFISKTIYDKNMEISSNWSLLKNRWC